MFRLRGADGLDLRLSFTASGQYIGGPCVARHDPGTLEINPANCGLTSREGRLDAVRQRGAVRRSEGGDPFGAHRGEPAHAGRDPLNVPAPARVGTSLHGRQYPEPSETRRQS